MKKSVLLVAVLAMGFTWGCAQHQSKPKIVDSKTGLQAIFFDYDKADIKPEYQGVLKSNAKVIKDGDNKSVVIAGHCDERGSDEYNIALGQRRASSVKDYLVSLGVSGGSLKTKSFGEEKPAKDCHEESCWSANRRAEFSAK